MHTGKRSQARNWQASQAGTANVPRQGTGKCSQAGNRWRPQAGDSGCSHAGNCRHCKSLATICHQPRGATPPPTSRVLCDKLACLLTGRGAIVKLLFSVFQLSLLVNYTYLRYRFTYPFFEDIDECIGAHDCHGNSTCNNTIGSYHCHCESGLYGNGFNCSNVDECNNSNLTSCHENARCQDTFGSYLCHCVSGYTGNGDNCTDFNECDMQNDCPFDAVCRNTLGSYSCQCQTGFNWNGTVCENSKKAGCLWTPYTHLQIFSNGVYSSLFRAKASGGHSKAQETPDAQFLQKVTRFALIGVGPTRPWVCTCPPPQIPVSQSPF